MGSILRNNRRMFWEVLNRIMDRKKRIIGIGLTVTHDAHARAEGLMVLQAGES